MEPIADAKRPRRRLGLRGLMALVAVVAMALPLVLPRFADRLRFAERYVRITLNQGDMYRHINGGRYFVEEFALAVRSGQPEVFRSMMTSGFQGRMDGPESRAFFEGSPMRRTPCELVEGSLSFLDDQGRFVSEYCYRCGPADDQPAFFKLVVVTETGRLKVDRIEPTGPPHD